MAVWKLTEAHYLMVPEHYWEQNEVDRETGRQKKKQYPVPTHLDPKDAGVWTHKTGERHISQGGNAFTDGEILVKWAKGYTYKRDADGFTFTCKVDDGDRKTLVFEGPPTPGMEPLDDEAKEVMKSFRWDDPVKDKYFGMSYAERLIMDKVTNEDASVNAKLIEALEAMTRTLHGMNGSKPSELRRL